MPSVILKVRNRDLIDYLGDERTFLTTALAAGDTASVVQDNAGFSQNNWVGIGEVHTERSEIKRITAAVTAGTALTIQAATFAHPIDTLIIKLPGDKIEFFRADTLTGTKSSLGSAQTINYQEEFSEFADSTNTSGYYWIKIWDSNTSAYVSGYIGGWNYSGNAIDNFGGMKELALQREGEEIGNLISNDWLDLELKAYRNHMKEKVNVDIELMSFSSEFASGSWRISLATSNIKNIKGNGSVIKAYWGLFKPLDLIPWNEYLDLLKGIAHTTVATTAAAGSTSLVLTDASSFTDPDGAKASATVGAVTFTYTGKTGDTLTGIPASGTGYLSATATAGDDAWQGATFGEPTKMCIWDGYAYFYSIPSSTENGVSITIEAFKGDSNELQTTDTIDVAKELGVIWLQWRILHLKKDYNAAKDKRLEFFQMRNEHFGTNDVNVDTEFSNDSDNTYTAV